MCVCRWTVFPWTSSETQDYVYKTHTYTYEHHTYTRTHPLLIVRVIAEDGGADISQAREVSWFSLALFSALVPSHCTLVAHCSEWVIVACFECPTNLKMETNCNSNQDINYNKETHGLQWSYFSIHLKICWLYWKLTNVIMVYSNKKTKTKKGWGGGLSNVQNYPCSVISKHELAAGFVWAGGVQGGGGRMWGVGVPKCYEMTPGCHQQLFTKVNYRVYLLVQSAAVQDLFFFLSLLFSPLKFCSGQCAGGDVN